MLAMSDRGNGGSSKPRVESGPGCDIQRTKPEKGSKGSEEVATHLVYVGDKWGTDIEESIR